MNQIYVNAYDVLNTILIDEGTGKNINYEQIQRLKKLNFKNNDDKIYINYFKIDDKILAHYVNKFINGNGNVEEIQFPYQTILGEFYLFGTYNEYTEKRSEYIVSLYSNGDITCNCPDYSKHCIKKNCLCKHICFILFKFGKLFDNYINICTTKKLNEYDIMQLMYISNNFINIYNNTITNINALNTSNNNINPLIINEYAKLVYMSNDNTHQHNENNFNPFKITETLLKLIDVNDTCPICCDALINNEIRC
jgi:hypothetical protein